MITKKFLAAFLCVFIMAASFSGCSDVTVTVNSNSSEATQPVQKATQTTESTTEAPKATDAAEATEKPDNKTNEVSSDLSSKWEDKQIQIDGKVFTIPFDYSELEKIGYKLDFDDTFIVDAQRQTLAGTIISPKGNKIRAMFLNNGTNAKDVRKCQIASFQYDPTSTDNLDDIVFPGGIKIGSAWEDVDKTYGKPEADNIFSDDGYMSYEYEAQAKDGLYVHMTISSFSDSKVTSMEYRVYNGSSVGNLEEWPE